MASTASATVRAVIVSLATLCFPSGVEAQSFTPARLVHLPLEHVPCPSVAGVSPMIVCQAVVPKNGWVSNRGAARCFSEHEEDGARAALIASRVMLAEFEPATVDGRRTKVRTSFRLQLSEENGVCHTTYLPNLGTQQDELGPNYFDPQEIVTRGSWADRARLTWRRGSAAGVAFSMSVSVDELGNATDGRVESNRFAPDDSVTAAVRALEKSRFVPGFVEGVARPARYLELHYVHGNCDSDPPTLADPDRC
jgi:hypothetical protein